MRYYTVARVISICSQCPLPRPLFALFLRNLQITFFSLSHFLPLSIPSASLPRNAAQSRRQLGLFLISVVFNFFNFSAAAPKMCTEGWSAVSSKRGICIFETRSRLITLWDRVTLRNIITRYNNNNNNFAGYCSKHGVTRRFSCHFFERTTQRVLSFCIFIRVKRREASPSKTKWIGLF